MLRSDKFEGDLALKNPKLKKNGPKLAYLALKNPVFLVLEVLTCKSTHSVLEINDVSTVCT